MAVEAQFLIPPKLAAYAEPFLRALAKAATAQGDVARIRDHYRREAGWLVLFGVGAAARHEARNLHVGNGQPALLWDIGYFGRKKLGGYCRVSIDHDHPQALLDATEPDPSRWEHHGISLREDADPAGPIILVGLGRKSRVYLGAQNWEQRAVADLRQRFPRRTIIHRPKPRQEYPKVETDKRDDQSPIGTLLRGASLVVARHSNVCIDAAVAGVPFECSDGAAMWLQQREFSPENRLDFLRRLAWWQWHQKEAAQAWQFLKGKIGCVPT